MKLFKTNYKQVTRISRGTIWKLYIMNIELKGNFFELTFKYRPAIVDKIREIPGRQFDGAKVVWTFLSSRRIELETVLFQIRQF